MDSISKQAIGDSPIAKDIAVQQSQRTMFVGTVVSDKPPGEVCGGYVVRFSNVYKVSGGIRKFCRPGGEDPRWIKAKTRRWTRSASIIVQLSEQKGTRGQREERED